MNIVKKLKEKYGEIDYGSEKAFSPTIYLFQKWAWKVEKNWYGICLSNVPFVWGKIIDEFLVELEKYCPDFKINQIKLKMGGLRFYITLNCDNKELLKEIRTEINELEGWLFDESLIY